MERCKRMALHMARKAPPFLGRVTRRCVWLSLARLGSAWLGVCPVSSLLWLSVLFPLTVRQTTPKA